MLEYARARLGGGEMAKVAMHSGIDSGFPL